MTLLNQKLKVSARNLFLTNLPGDSDVSWSFENNKIDLWCVRSDHIVWGRKVSGDEINTESCR